MAKILCSVDIEVSVDQYYNAMSDDEAFDMFVSIIESNNDKLRIYKELAYVVGNSDSSNLEYLINELEYWRK